MLLFLIEDGVVGDMPIVKSGSVVSIPSTLLVLICFVVLFAWSVALTQI